MRFIEEFEKHKKKKEDFCKKMRVTLFATDFFVLLDGMDNL